MSDTPSAMASDALASLRRLCSPQVYRTNPFRLLGAPTTSTTRDLARLTEKRRLAEKLGAAVATESGPLPLAPPPDDEAIRGAMHQLRDPESRILGELFWFQPRGALDADVALAALTRGDSAGAVRSWSDDDPDGVGLHNRAVLAHATALDLELAARQLSSTEVELRDRSWREAYRHWRALLAHEGFWSRFNTRVRELDDPRLTTGIARRIRLQLPEHLLLISARLMATAGEAGSVKEAARHFRIISESGSDDTSVTVRDRRRVRAEAEPGGFDERARSDALRTALSPLRQRISLFCSNAQAEADKHPERANKACKTLLDQTAPLLGVFALLPENDAARVGVHDDVALKALACQIAYGNKTSMWVESLDLLKRIRQIAASPSTRGRIDLNIETVTQNVAFAQEFGKCFFCADAKAEDDAAIGVKMHGNVREVPTWQGVRILWNHGEIKVPRCAACKSVHERSEGVAGSLGCATVLLGFGACGAIGFEEGGFIAGIAGLVAGGIAFAVVDSLMRGKIRGSGDASKFSAVQRRLEEGWKIGEKPEGVQ